jgi:hypothetical protein
MVPGSDIYVGPAVIGSIATIYTLVALFRMIESLLTPLSLRDTPVLSSEGTRAA